MPVNDREVYEHFNSRPGDLREVIALAYAGYAKAKYDWMAHVEAREGRPPSLEETDRWIADLPDSRLEDLRRDAVDFFDLAARAYMANEFENASVEARDDAIVREVHVGNQQTLARIENATSFRSTFWPNVFIGIVASIAFSLLIILATLIFVNDPSPFAILRGLQQPAKAQ